MGARLVKFEFCPKEHEQIEALIKLPEEKRSVIHGTVKDCNNHPIKDAVVKLFEKIKTTHGTKLKPLTHAFTDDCGEFLFGPLHPNKEYAIKIWYDDIVKRELNFNSGYCNDKSDYDNDYDHDNDHSCGNHDDYDNNCCNHYKNEYECNVHQEDHCDSTTSDD